MYKRMLNEIIAAQAGKLQRRHGNEIPDNRCAIPGMTS